jgi:hypothetical protein|tara:strand:- start:7085 stop:8077 length:993 start_codon:yes stop_codon:yes gene_type:complete
MENATQEDALESEDVVVTEEVTETQTEEDITTPVNPLSAREKALEEIYNRRREEEGVEDVQEVLEDTPEAPVWHDGEKWLTKIKVNGEEVDVSFDSLKSSHQKDKASQEKFQAAAVKERELLYREQHLQEQFEQLKSQPSGQDVEKKEEVSDVDDIVEKYHEALFQDDAVEAAKLLRTLASSGRGNATQNIQEVVNQAIVSHEARKKAEQEHIQRAAYQAELEDAVKSFNEDYPDIAESEELRAIADRKTITLTQENPDWTPSQIINAAAEYTREWAGISLESNGRFNRKKKIVRQPKSVRASANSSKESVPLTPSEIVAEMRKARGQTI